MTALRRPGLLLLHALLLGLLLLWLPGRDTARAAEDSSADCRADQLREAKVDAAAKFDHRGRDYSMLTSTMDIRIPEGWEQAPDLLLDTHSHDYRFALNCLLGKVTEESFFDDEWRLKPVTVTADGKSVVIHYQAVQWIQGLGEYRVGPWYLDAEWAEWNIRLNPPENLVDAVWDVRIHLGGPGAMSAAPPPAFGEKGTTVRWHNRNPAELPGVIFRPPSPQQWNAITASPGQFWEALGYYSASGAFWYVASGVLLIVCARRLRRSLGGSPRPKEKNAIRILILWTFLQMGLALVVLMGDNLYRSLAHSLSKYDYLPAVQLFSMMLLGLSLCFFGKVRRRLLVVVCTFVLGVAAAYLASELTEFPVMPTSDALLAPPGTWTVLIAYLVLIFVCCLGLISAGQRLLFAGDRAMPPWVAVSVSLAAAAMTLLWSYLAFERYWDRRSWLADPDWKSYAGQWSSEYDAWWWWTFPDELLNTLIGYVSILTSVAVVGVLRVCRAEQYDDDSFTPNDAEKTLFVVFFALAVVPGNAWYFGFSGYLLTLALGLGSAWGVLALGTSRSVLEQLSAENAPLGKVISRTSRSDVLRLARRFRELQSHLQRLGTASQSDRTSVQESIEREIDRLDQCLPERVRPIDLPFAYGPMHSWWDNACRCALIACFIGLPATALMYWTEAVQNETWIGVTQNSSGFLWIVYEILFWHIGWVAGGFFLGAVWRDLPGRHGPTKAFCVAVAFAVPVAAHQIVTQSIGQSTPVALRSIAAFASVLTFTGLAMDIQTFQSERRYWPTNMSLVAYVYQMRIASVAFFLAQVLALATIWKTIREGGPTPPPSR
ncbi:DUF6185 family protein [Streptomyces sp. NPDC046876]|uniref:DUF6185 family protein n=1 Tax=Streptomyces sp. NPDC046876 TaxID=3155616 RepID=UPI0033D5A82B